MASRINWNHHIEAWQASGLSQAAYCRLNRLGISTFSARLSILSIDSSKSVYTTKFTHPEEMQDGNKMPLAPAAIASSASTQLGVRFFG